MCELQGQFVTTCDLEPLTTKSLGSLTPSQSPYTHYSGLPP